MSIITNFSMFFLSFLPLWISVLFIDIKSICEASPNIWTEIICIFAILITGIISFLVLMFIMKPKEEGTQEYNVISAKNQKTITADYLLLYILPLFAFDFTVWSGVVLFLIFFSVLSFLSVRHSQFSVNIVLELMGYRTYACELENIEKAKKVKIDKLVISKEILSAQNGARILIRPINNEYVMHLSKKK